MANPKTPLTAYGALKTAELTPVVQIDALGGLRTVSDVETFTATGGSVDVTNSGTGYEFRCQSGTSVGGYGLVRSKRFARYRPGQGISLRYSARFPSEGVALGAVRAGGIGSGTEISFGYDGVNFGILFRTGGLLETQTLTISAAATGAETATITLNGTDFTTAVTAGTIPHNAFEIAADTFTGYEVYQNGNTVTFVATAVGVQAGAFTLASTGTLAGTFAETVVGSAVTDTWVYQNQWNIDHLDGEGPSGMTLDVTKGNVYEIEYQYLGYGELLYRVEDPGTGLFTPVHRIQYANNYDSPSLTQPILRVGWFAASLGSTTNLSIYGAAASAFVEGKVKQLRNPGAHSHKKAGITTTLTNIISFRVKAIFNGIINVTEVIPLLATIAVDGTKPAEALVVINPTLGGEPNWTDHDGGNDTIEYDTAATTVTGGQDVVGLSLGKEASQIVDLKPLGFILNRGDIITIAVRATASTTDVAASFTWLED